jgi:DNA polymerase-1
VPLKYGNRKQDFTHNQQQIAKTINFGTFYGRTPLSIAREFGVTVAEAERWQMKILNKYPKLLRYKRRCEEAFRTKGYLESPFGRIRYLTSLTQGYNFPVQSAASDITLYSIVLSDKHDLWCWATVHDSIVYQVPIDKYDEQLKLIKSIIERPIPELDNVTFKADYKQGRDWYNMTEA